eukprot:TRINITY_DN8493_c0_g1_i6.p1 TRINITY_DN8493_c0_g1~~TRINITY_DN8493_c0_g1_i6.p1  ORF type:complete len:177 (+),score=25.49 TRINITY_DN8493_c0_g1_i6:333-863(+)
MLLCSKSHVRARISDVACSVVRQVLVLTANEGKYLDKEVWPTLQPALVKLLEAIKWNIPKHIRQQYQDPTMRRTLHPEHADFNPVHWLATFLKEHNPNKPSRLSPDQAAVVLQTAVRGRNARRRVADMRTARENKIAQDIEDARRHAAAVKVQAAYRGHSVRLALSMGRLTDLRSW